MLLFISWKLTSVEIISMEINMQENEMKRLYDSGMSCMEIAKIFGYKTPKSISDKLVKIGVKLRTGQNKNSQTVIYNTDIFKKIDTEWKAYYLGLLLTDGWITNRKDGVIDTVGYSSVDKDAAEYVSICTGKPIQVVNKPSKVVGPNGDLINQSTEYRVVLTSVEMVKDLQRLGVVENKTHILKGPNLLIDELVYLPQILRGIIDGDGTLGFPSNNLSSMYFRIISASEDFIDWCIWALNVLGMRDINKRKINNILWELNSARPSNIAILTNSIYRGNFGMSRKYNLIHNHFNTNFKTVASVSNG